MEKILINCLGIHDSGGITVLEILLEDLKNAPYNFVIVCNSSANIHHLILKYEIVNSFEFVLIPFKGFLYRLFFENVIFRKIIKQKEIRLIYNFSGTAQFFVAIPQLIKMHNLLFYSQKNDQVYFAQRKYFMWLKQIFFKRIVFRLMMQCASYVEVQSLHVQRAMEQIIKIENKQFFIKSDINIEKKNFKQPVKYNFSEKIRFMYIVGPHFEYVHKNIEDFVRGMIALQNIDFEILITLTQDQLHHSAYWDCVLDEKTHFLGYVTKEALIDQFKDNTILLSTSVIETLGLHVIEAIQNGLLVVAPDEPYAHSVYGDGISTYTLFNIQSMLDTIASLKQIDLKSIEKIILDNQRYLLESESNKIQSVKSIFAEILKDKYVQK